MTNHPAGRNAEPAETIKIHHGKLMKLNLIREYYTDACLTA